MTGAFQTETDLLTSPEVAGLLQLALTGDPQVVLPGFTARQDDLHYRPGSEVTAIYTVTYQSATNQTQVEHLVATTAAVQGAVATLSSGDTTLRVWRHPADPRLSSFAAACDPRIVLGWLADAGLKTPGALHVELLGYRPLRRAVLEVDADSERYYLKVMRPGYDEPLVQRQEILAQAGLTVPILARPAPGVILTPSAPGRSLAQVLADGAAGGSWVPEPADLVALLDRLPSQVLGLPTRKSWSQHLDFHAATACQQLPEQTTRINALQTRIDRVLSEHRHGPVVPTHGDFYEANIFVNGTRLSLIDIDSVGPGLREDDLACCLAHLAVLPTLDPDGYHHVAELLQDWRQAFEATVDPIDLRARTAAVLVSLISGADPDQALLRLGLAEEQM